MGSAGTKLNGGPAYRRRKRERLFADQGGRCCWCGFAMTDELMSGGGEPSMTRATWEHKVPIVRGGSGRIENMGLACYLCNQLHGVLYRRLTFGFCLKRVD